MARTPYVKNYETYEDLPSEDTPITAGVMNNIESGIKGIDEDLAPAETSILGKTPNNGWIAGIGTWSYSSADSPTFVISVNADVTGLIGVGDRIKLTQTTTKYFIVTAVGAYSGGATLVTVYGGTDYTLANTSITNPYYSHIKNPFGFPTAKSKWTKMSTVSYYISVAAPPGDGTVYNPDGNYYDLPIGEWEVDVEGTYKITRGSSGTISVSAGISTSNNSISSTSLIEPDVYTNQTVTQKVFKVTATIAVTSKTRYYHVVKVDGAGYSLIEMQNGYHNSRIRAVCAYL